MIQNFSINSNKLKIFLPKFEVVRKRVDYGGYSSFTSTDSWVWRLANRDNNSIANGMLFRAMYYPPSVTETYTEPMLDENGTPMTDSDGNPILVTKERKVLDAKAYETELLRGEPNHGYDNELGYKVDEYPLVIDPVTGLADSFACVYYKIDTNDFFDNYVLYPFGNAANFIEQEKILLDNLRKRIKYDNDMDDIFAPEFIVI